jgi:hypothetical protein
MSRKKISTTIYVTPEQSDRLKLLHERTKVPVAVYIREGIDLVLNHYGHLLPGQLQLAEGRALLTPTRADRAEPSDADEPERSSSTSAPGQASLPAHAASAAAKK